MATGDVTTYGPYSPANISSVKTDLEADSVVVADSLVVAPTSNGQEFYVIRVEA